MSKYKIIGNQIEITTTPMTEVLDAETVYNNDKQSIINLNYEKSRLEERIAEIDSEIIAKTERLNLLKPIVEPEE